MIDKWVLITGATGKLGSQIATELAKKHWNIVITSRKHDRAEQFAAKLSQYDGDVVGLPLDLSSSSGTQEFLSQLHEKKIEPTHIVNNARNLELLKTNDFGLTDSRDFVGELEIDVVQPYQLVTELAREENSKLECVVNIGSQYGVVAPNLSLYGGDAASSPIQYGVAKAALHHLTKELAVRLAPKVRVNCVAFGGVEGRVDAEFLKRYKKLTPAGRMLRESEIAGPVEFLLSDDSSAVNGHILVADGGWSIW